MPNGFLKASFFQHLQELYNERTGYNLVLSDANGSIQMGLPDCVKFPCMQSCRECRERIVSEAIRTGQVCVDSCHDGYILWGLPYAVNGHVQGALIVIGGEQDLKDRTRFERACRELHVLMEEFSLLPEWIHDGKGNEAVIPHRYICRKAFNKLSKALDEHVRPFVAALQTAEFESAEGHFSLIRQAFREGNELPMDVLRGLVGDLISRARGQFVDAGMDAYACSAEAGLVLEKVSAARDASEIETILEQFLERFVFLSHKRTKDPDDLLIEKATTYLEQHVHEELTRESVARAVGISPSHFSRLIREKKGRTFTDLLNQYRIERACTLLVRSSDTLAQIANDTGFCDQSYFSKVFRRYKDMTPARYRESHQL
ncbi:MAG: helix-turn-helix domain-containing protein [Oceanipulchritudo sp.]